MDGEPASASAHTRAPSRSRKALIAVKTFLFAHLTALGVFAAAVLCYALLGFFFAPYVARVQIEKYVSETLERRVSIGEVRFNPFWFDASVRRFELLESDGRPLVSFRHLYADLELASLWRRALVFADLQLSAPRVHVVVAQDGAVNLAALAPPTDPSAAASEDEMLAVHIESFGVREGRIDIADLSRPRPFATHIAPIRFSLTNFRTDPAHDNAYRFAGRTHAGEELEWSGHFTVQPRLGSDGAFRVRDLRAATLDAYLADDASFALASGRIDVNGRYQFALDPLTLLIETSVAVHDLALAPRDAGESPPLRLPRVEMTNARLALHERALQIERLQFEGASVEVVREADGSLNLARLLPADPPSAEPDASAAAHPWYLGVDRIELVNGAMTAEDRTVTPAVKLDASSVSAALNDWSTQASATAHVEAAATLNGEGRLQVRGDVQLAPLAGALTIEASDLPLARLQSYIDQRTAMTLHSGALRADGELSFAEAEEGYTLGYKGQAGVANLRTTDQLENADFVRWRDLQLEGVTYASEASALTIDRIIARQLYASVIIAEDSTLNVSRVLESETTQGGEPSAERGAEEEAPMKIVIGRVEVIDGAAQFADNNIQPSFATTIQSLNGVVTGLSSERRTRAKVELTGKVDRYAPVDIKGEVNLLSAALYTDVAMDFRNMELTTFNPYSGKFAGYSISKGKLSTELKYLVDDRTLEAQHHIVIDNLEFGEKTDSKDAAPIPIKFAVALLKDRNGVIDVNLPVSGTLDDPQFRLGPIIWQAVLGLLKRIATAPFTALGALFGGGEDLAFVDFEAGSSELTIDASGKLATLAKALAERPQLRLDVPLTVSGERDMESLARRSLDEQLAAAANADASERWRALESVYTSVVAQPPAWPKDLAPKKRERAVAQETLSAREQWLEAALLEKLSPDPADLAELARARAQAVQAALLADGQIDPQRVFITTDRGAALTSDGRVRMEMKLE